MVLFGIIYRTRTMSDNSFIRGSGSAKHRLHMMILQKDKVFIHAAGRTKTEAYERLKALEKVHVYALNKDEVEGRQYLSVGIPEHYQIARRDAVC